MKTRTKVKVPVVKPRNPLVLPPNKVHQDKRKKEKHKQDIQKELQ